MTRTTSFLFISLLALVTLAAAPAFAQFHTADKDHDNVISLSELLRVVQFYNVGTLHCQAGTEDGYDPGPGDESCAPHDSDYKPQDWTINLSEILRLVQYFNSEPYVVDPTQEDGFRPGPPIVIPTEGEGEGEGGVEGEGEGEGEGGAEGEGEGEGPQLVEVHIISTQGQPGEDVLVQLVLDNSNTTTGTLQFDLNYDFQNLTYEATSSGAIVGAAGKTITATPLPPSQVRIKLTDPAPVSGVGDGVLALVAFTVSPNANFGDTLQIFGSSIAVKKPDGATVDSNISSGTITVISDQPVAPTANFSAQPTVGLVNTDVKFTDTSKRGTQPITTWLWNFGDGSTSSDQNPDHVYAAAGTYDVTLTATSAVGSDSETKAGFIQIVAGSTIFVDKAHTADPQNGLSWATAFSNLQAGIDAAAALGGGEVWVASGTYDEVRDNDTGSLLMKPVVRVYGGFIGGETDLSQRDFANRLTVIEGGSARAGDAAYHVVIGAENSTLDGFTVRGGNASTTGTSTATQEGGGMYNNANGLTVANCKFANNQASFAGAAMYNTDSSISIQNCVFDGNVTTNTGAPDSFGYGGAIYNIRCFVDLTGCTLSNNSARSTAIWTSGGNINSQSSGGALFNSDSDVNITSCSFEGNLSSASGSGGSSFTAIPFATGGAVTNNFGHVVISRTIFRSNQAKTNNNGTVGSAFGAGIYSSSAQLTITNSILFGNASTDFTGSASGTGIYVDNTQQPNAVVVTNCSLVNNISNSLNASHAGGIYSFNASPVITNDIFWNNSGLQINGVNSSPDVTYSDVQGGQAGTGNIDVFPSFEDMNTANLHLLIVSPCVDTGRDTSGAAFGSVTTDIDGNQRGFDAVSFQTADGSEYDMGADEFTP